jgi:phosphoglycerate dehydrogenase-like enzyme
MCTAAQTVPGHRHQPHEGPLRVLVGKERFSEDHPWSDMPRHWPAGLAGRAVIEVVGQGQLEARLADGGPPADVVVPLWSPLPGRAIRAGSFGLIQQFGVGVDNIDLDAAADEGVWVANMAGLNAGLGLDVFPTEPYPADGPLVTHPRIVATAHTASLTSDYFAAASRRLGDALARYLDQQPPSGLLR